MQNNNTKKIFSVFSGTFYEILEKDVPILNNGQIILKQEFKACSKCYKRGYVGRNAETLVFNPCNCVRKSVDLVLTNNNANNN